MACGRGMHLALNSGHDGWFPDVIQWNCAAPSRRLMKTHASSGASQMIPGRAYVPHVVAFGSVPLYTLMAFRVQLGCLEIRGFRGASRPCAPSRVRNVGKIPSAVYRVLRFRIEYRDTSLLRYTRARERISEEISGNSLNLRRDSMSQRSTLISGKE